MTYPNDPNTNFNGQTPQRPFPNRPQFISRPPQPPRFWQIVLKDFAMTVVGVVLFCFILFLFAIGTVVTLAKVVGSVGPSTAGLVETTIKGDEACDGKVVILPIEGIIETDETGFIPTAIESLREDKRVRALVLRVNSPGGTISGSDYYLHLLKQLKEDLGIPVIVSMGDLAASGGYYISTVGDKIFAERSTTTGSIGVIVSMYNAAELCKKLGVRSNPVTSGAMKGMGDFMKEPTPEETAIWQKMVDDSYEQFLNVIKEGREWYRDGDSKGTGPKTKRERLSGVKVETISEEDANGEEAADSADGGKSEEQTEKAEKEAPESNESVADERDAQLRKLADGRIYSAQEAKDLHLIDEIGFLDEALDAAISEAGLDKSKTQIVRYEEEKGLFDSFTAVKSKSDPLTQALKTIGTPRGYYICPRALPAFDK